MAERRIDTTSTPKDKLAASDTGISFFSIDRLVTEAGKPSCNIVWQGSLFSEVRWQKPHSAVFEVWHCEEQHSQLASMQGKPMSCWQVLASTSGKRLKPRAISIEVSRDPVKGLHDVACLQLFYDVFCVFYLLCWEIVWAVCEVWKMLLLPRCQFSWQRRFNFVQRGAFAFLAPRLHWGIFDFRFLVRGAQTCQLVCSPALLACQSGYG